MAKERNTVGHLVFASVMHRRVPVGRKCKNVGFEIDDQRPNAVFLPVTSGVMQGSAALQVFGVNVTACSAKQGVDDDIVPILCGDMQGSPAVQVFGVGGSFSLKQGVDDDIVPILCGDMQGSPALEVFAQDRRTLSIT